MSSHYWKKKALKLAEENDLVIVAEKQYGRWIGEISHKDPLIRFEGYDDESDALTLDGVDGYYWDPDWKLAFERVQMIIDDGFYTIDEDDQYWGIP